MSTMIGTDRYPPLSLGLPSGERSTLPVEHHVDELATVLTGAESSRESVALPAEPSLVEPKIRYRG